MDFSNSNLLVAVAVNVCTGVAIIATMRANQAAAASRLDDIEEEIKKLPKDYVPRSELERALGYLTDLTKETNQLFMAYLRGRGDSTLRSIQAAAAGHTTLDAASEQRLTLIVPILAEKVRRAHVAFATQTGSFFRVVEGLRTYAEQNDLYEKGRTKPGNIVTNARGGYSNHNFGMAVDCAPDVHGSATYKPDWATAHPDWHAMVACLKAEGLAWGGDWHGAIKADVDHFQLAGVDATPNATDRETCAAGGLAKVWAMYGFGDSVVRGISASASLSLHDEITRTIVEDFEEQGPIYKAFEGWQG